MFRVKYLSAAMLALSSSVALADFHVDNGPSPDMPMPPPAVQSGVFRAVVAQNGTPDNFMIVRGFARDLPLATALQQVVPASFKVVFPDEYGQRTVSWQGGRPWLDVLTQVATAAGLDVEVNWDMHVATLRPAPEALAVAVNANPSQAVAMNSEMSPVALASAPVLPPVVAPVDHLWVLNPEMTLRENVKEWANEAGWSVLWTAVDYPVTGKTTLRGGFDSPDGPIHELALAYEKAQQPLAFEMFRANRVVRVRGIISSKPNVSPLATDPTSINPSGSSPDPDAHIK